MSARDRTPVQPKLALLAIAGLLVLVIVTVAVDASVDGVFRLSSLMSFVER
jgi:hypothetical protein